MLRITKEFNFSASHVLAHLRDGHPCGRIHGHNYLVVLELSAPVEKLNRAGFVRDFNDLKCVKLWLDETVDHRHLNDVLGDLNPSAEHIAKWIYEQWCGKLRELTAVRVSETPRTWVEYRPDN